jgi:hypothetical protein
MKIREWSQKILWFVFGAMSIGLLIFISTAYGRRTGVILTLEQRVASLEQRVKSLEERNDEESKRERDQKRDMNRKEPGDKPE